MSLRVRSSSRLSRSPLCTLQPAQFGVGVKSQRCVIHRGLRVRSASASGLQHRRSKRVVTTLECDRHSSRSCPCCAWLCVSWSAGTSRRRHVRKLIDRSACLVEPVVVERVLFSSLPCSCKPAPSTSSAASSRCSRMSPSRGLVERLVLLRAAHSELLLSLHCDCTSHLGYSACLVIG